MMKRAELIALSLLLCFAFAVSTRAVQEPQLTEDQMRQFLLTAKVIQNKSASKGVTHTLRLTLSDGNITHDASFQSIDEHKSRFEGEGGTVEINFVDSYKYNIAAYELAKLIGLGDMMPVPDQYQIKVNEFDFTAEKPYYRTRSVISWICEKIEFQLKSSNSL